jgi:hypothetical protein
VLIVLTVYEDGRVGADDGATEGLGEGTVDGTPEGGVEGADVGAPVGLSCKEIFLILELEPSTTSSEVSQ